MLCGNSNVLWLLTLTVVVFLVCSLTRSSKFTSCGSPSCGMARAHQAVQETVQQLRASNARAKS